MVADYDSSQLLLLGKDGKSVQVLAENGAEAGSVGYPSGLALNKDLGLLFVRTCTWGPKHMHRRMLCTPVCASSRVSLELKR